MKNIIKFLLLIAVGVASTSCKDFLYPDSIDKLTDEEYYSSDEQIESSLTAIYYALRTSALGSNYTLNFAGNTDEDIQATQGSSTDHPLRYNMSSTNSNVLSFWTGLYAPLKNIAYLLDGLERNRENLTESVYLHAKGEALFLRGYFHFMLVQWWGDPDTGLPLYTEKILTYEETSMPLSSVDEFYVQIVEDMEAAEVLLADQTWASLGYSERVTLDTVRGMLARVCLFAAGFPNNGMYKGESNPDYYYRKALAKGLLVTEMGHTLVDDYSEVFIAHVEDRYNSESLWEVGYTYAGSDNSETNCAGAVGSQFGMYRLYSYLDDTGGYVYDSLLCTSYGKYMNPRLYNSYGFGDERREWNAPTFTYERASLRVVPKTLSTSNCSESEMGGDNYTSGTLPSTFLWATGTGKWRRVYESRDMTRDGTSTGTNHPLLRYSDVLLMVAEAYIELGEPARAVPYINEVRSRAIPYSTPTKVVSRIIAALSSANQYGWTYEPVVNVVDPGSGTGFEFITQGEMWTNGRGIFSIGITNPGSGYDVAPQLEVEPPVATWQANTYYEIGTYVTVETETGKMRVYYANSSGTSTNVYPTHTTTLYDDDGTNTATDPTLTDALNEQGVKWLHKYGTVTIGNAPTLSIQTMDSVVADLEYYVNSSDQEAMREFLREERARELCFEALRRMDLKRWGILVETVKQGYDDYMGYTEGIPLGGTASNLSACAEWIQEYHNYLPIPNAQISLNRNLIQTAGY